MQFCCLFALVLVAGVAEFFKLVAHGDDSFCIDEEGAEFCLCGG